MDGEEPSEVFGRIWDEYGFHVESDKAHLLSIVLYDPYTNQTFVGHTGVMIQEEGSVLFVEKIAFEQPYQAIRAESIDQLLKILAERPAVYLCQNAAVRSYCKNLSGGACFMNADSVKARLKNFAVSPKNF